MNVQDYITHGWSIVAIPPGTKGPHHPGWQTRKGVLANAALLPPNYGVGLAHAYSGTMAIDVDDWARTCELGIDVTALAAAPDSVMIESGKPNHGKLLYRMPGGLRLPSYQKTENKKAIYNFRCGTHDDLTVQDVLPPTIHPDTNQPYRWAGNGDWRRLPMLPQLILELWTESLKDSRPARVNGVDSSWDEIRGALEYLDPDCDRGDWVHVGMALKWAGEQTFNPDQAFALWDGWSAKGSKYKGQRETVQQWRSFRSEKSQVVTLGTLFHLATKNGWTRPVPDASVLFGDVSAMVAPQDVIATMKAAPPDIDLSLWPPVLAKRAQEVSDSVGCDPIVPLWAGLAAACGVVDAQSRLELMPGFRVPPVLWLMTIGDPGDRKTPGSTPMMEPLAAIEAGDHQRYARDRQIWDYNQAVYASAHKAMMNYAGSPDGLLAPEQAPVVPPEPVAPVPLKFTVEDVTSQKLVHLCQQRPRGMLAYLDEMNGLVQRITNKQSGENRSTWVRGFESKRYEMDRVSNGSTHCENFAVSIYGNMQPQVLAEHFNSLASDGFLQRFLPAVLRHNKTRISQPIPEFMNTASAWENCLRLTYSLEQKTYRLTPEAFQVFRQFQEWFEDRMQQERLMKSSPEFMHAFGKMTGTVGRLVLMFHIIENPWGPAVSEDLMKRVIRIAREYIIPTYRYVFDGDGSSSSYDSWVMDHIIQHADLDRITLSEIKRSGKRQLERANVKTSWQQNEWTMNAMYLLEKMQWVARVDDGGREGSGHATWLINPHLRTTFKAYRDAVVRAKLERNADRLEKAGSLQPNTTHGAESLDLV
jgi:hypothetical protein